MAETKMAPSVAVDQAVRTYAEHPPLTREQAAEHLKSRGVLPPGPDGKPHYVAPATLPAHLAALLDAPKADPTATAKVLETTGHDPQAVIAKVQGLIGSDHKAAELTAPALLYLAAFVDHHAAMAERFKK